MVSTNKDDLNVILVPLNMYYAPFINPKCCVGAKFVNSPSFR